MSSRQLICEYRAHKILLLRLTRFAIAQKNYFYDSTQNNSNRIVQTGQKDNLECILLNCTKQSNWLLDLAISNQYTQFESIISLLVPSSSSREKYLSIWLLKVGKRAKDFHKLTFHERKIRVKVSAQFGYKSTATSRFTVVGLLSSAPQKLKVALIVSNAFCFWLRAQAFNGLLHFMP